MASSSTSKIHVNPSKVPYPGQAKSNADPYGLCYYCDLTSAQKSELYNVVMRGEENVLKRAMTAKSNESSRFFPDYQSTELWCYNYWHESPDDEREHATFRLFEDVHTKPWNDRTYHLYKDGTSRSWRHEKFEAEERPT